MAFLVIAPHLAQSAKGEVVTVYRGADATAVPLPTGGALQVQRGAAVKMMATVAHDDVGRGIRTLLAGDRLWFVDTGSSRLTTCALQNSIQVGRKDIRCFTRDLPASLLRAAD